MYIRSSRFKVCREVDILEQCLIVFFIITVSETEQVKHVLVMFGELRRFRRIVLVSVLKCFA